MSGAAQVPVPRSFDIGQVLNRMLQLVKANLKLFIGISAAPSAVTFGLYGAVAAAFLIPFLSRLHSAPTAEQLIQMFSALGPILILLFILNWLVFALHLAASAYAAVQADYGVRVSFGEAYAAAWRSAGRYFLLLLIIYAICFFPSLLIQLLMFGVVGLTVLHKSQPNPLVFAAFPFAMLLQTALLVVGVFIALRFSLAFPASVTENLPAVEALRRSAWITRGARMKIFLVLLIIYAASYLGILLLMCGGMFLVVIGALAFSGFHVAVGSAIFWVLVTVVVAVFAGFMVLLTAVLWAVYATALAVIYNGQRRLMDAPGVSPLVSGAPA